MANDQLLAYIRTAKAGGSNVADIEKALLASGWQASDIRDAFAMLLNPSPTPTSALVPTSVPAVPVQPAPATDFIKEMERRRGEPRAAAPQDPQIVVKTSLSQISRRPSSEEGGLIGLLLKHKIVSTKQQANTVLVVVLVAVVALIVWINFF